ncbi:hypothetical protein H6P81_020374 [Aristolochia fimbriata]|uniref:DRBM domain-containing protein n=1 Tax=Aristolochia fimbriata TaxID=158543 RepID=A0AAV7DUJ4_ARIFI|nr:hypothetical protein H6P81_020374 [Aristolochia fimbriata]
MSPGGHFSGVSNCYVFKSRLQEYAQKAGIPTPVYETVKEGPSHEPSFRSTVIVNNVRYDSLPGFFNRKAAEQSAAEIAFMEILKSGSMSEYISHPVHETGLCKNLLQEYAQKMNYAIPSYTIIKQATSGKLPFSCTVEIGGIQYIGAAARTKKEAEIKAARTALLAIQSSSGKSGSKQEGGYAYTVLPCKKKGRDSETRSEATKPLKPRKAGLKKKWSKRRFHRIKGDRSKPIQSQQENANGEDSQAGPENYLETLKGVMTSQEGQIDRSFVDISNGQGSTNMQDFQDGQMKSMNKDFLVSHWGFNSNQNGATRILETTSNSHVVTRSLDTTASNVSEEGRAEAPNYHSIYKDITMVSEVNTVSSDAGVDLVFSYPRMVELGTSERKEIYVLPNHIEERNCREQPWEPMELECAQQEEGCESKFPAKHCESSGHECVKQVERIHVSAPLSTPISVEDGGVYSPDIGYDKMVPQRPSATSAIVSIGDAAVSSTGPVFVKQVTLSMPVGISNQDPVGEAGMSSSGTEHVNQVLLQVPVGPSEQVPVGDASVDSLGTGYVKRVDETQVLPEPSQSIVVEEAAISISNCCHESY